MNTPVSPPAHTVSLLARLRLGRPVQVANGTLEALKWFALVLMTLDHVNKFIFAGALPVVSEAGRLVMPIFGYVLAYNLARPELGKDGMARVARRLLIYGVLATPVYVALRTDLMQRLYTDQAPEILWLPLNILFTLLLATLIITLIQRRQQAWLMVAAAGFAWGGPFVEYAWFGLAFVLASWYHCRQGSVLSAATLLLAALGLFAPNDNLYALLALPLLLLASRFSVRVSRWPHVFYLYYPLHLAGIWMWMLVTRPSI